jgi:hypothetical protein
MVNNVHLSRIEGESWAGAVRSEAYFLSDASSWSTLPIPRRPLSPLRSMSPVRALPLLFDIVRG